MVRPIDVDPEHRDRLGALIAATWRGVSEATALLWAQELLTSWRADQVARAIRASGRESPEPSMARIVEQCRRLDAEQEGRRSLPARTPARMTPAVQQANRMVVAAVRLGEARAYAAMRMGEDPAAHRLSQEEVDDLWQRALRCGPERTREATDRMWLDAGRSLRDLDRSASLAQVTAPSVDE